jgi:hypothetical protein
MMTRTFSAFDLVTLPRVSAPAAMTLGTALLTSARKEVALPPVFVRPLKRLEAGVDTLRTSRQLQREVQAADASLAGEADQELDGAWAGFQGLLLGWAKLTTTPEGAEGARRARALLEAIFPQGLRFVNLPYRLQWAESQTRVDRLDEPELAEHVRALGGGPFVEAIKVAHAAYGVALNVTDRRTEAKARAKVREPLEGFLTGLRSYVLRVANYLDESEGDEAAHALTYRLLEPLATWKSAGGSGRKGDAPEGDEGGEGGEGGEPGDEAGEPEVPLGV